MTDRLKGVVVTFEADIREDDAQSLIQAIYMLKGVESVAVNVVKHDDHMNREMIRREFKNKLYDVLK